MILKILIMIIIGSGSGFIVSGGIFTFIGMIGIVPRMATKTKTEDFVMLFEDSITAGGMFGALLTFTNLSFDLQKFFILFIPFWFCQGIFMGCLAVSLAEVMDVIPITARRLRLRNGLYIVIFALACGKVVGSLAYFFTNVFVER